MKMFQLKLDTVKEGEEDPPPPTKDNPLDELLTSLGQFGCYQLSSCLLLCVPILCFNFYSISYVFTASNVNHRCNISQCDTLDSNFTERWVNFTIPEENNDWDQCEQFEAMDGIDGHCESHHFNRSSRISCEAGYVFKDNENTISKEFGILCSDQWQLYMVGTVNQIGQFLGIPLGGYLSDIYGRKTILVAAGMLGSLCGLARSYAPEYYSFLFLEFLNMIVSSTMFPTAFLVAIELVSPKQRVLSVLVVVSSQSIAGTALGFLASYILDWRVLLRVLHTPGLLHLILLCALPESVRWLLSQSKEDDAIYILRKLAHYNHQPLPEQQLSELMRKNRKIIAESEAPSGHFGVRQIFSALGPRIAQCCLLWFCHRLIVLGLVLNTQSLDGNKFHNYSFTQAMGLPGILLCGLLMNRVGRRWTMCITLCSCSVLLVAITILDSNWSLYLYILTKMFAVASYVTLYFYTFEIFPTSCRNTLMSFCSMIGSIGSMLAPQTPLLTEYYEYAPHLLISALGVLGSLTVLSLPETTNKVLPTTLKEAVVLDQVCQTIPKKAAF